MTKHYLKISLRNMRKFKLQTIVCLTGLAVGMTCFTLGTLWLRYIASFEDFVYDADNVCYVTSGYDEGRSLWNYFTRSLDGEKLVEKYPELKDWCVIRATPDLPLEGRQATLNVGNQPFKVEAIRTDTTFFRFFRIRPLSGDVSHFGEGQVVLTESMAKKMFGSKPAVGQEVFMQTNNWEATLGHEEANSEPQVVAAVIPDCPRNTQFGYEAVLPFDDMPRGDQYSVNYCTFVRLHAKAGRDSIVGRELEVEYPVGSSGFNETKKVMPQPLRLLRRDFNAGNIQISTTYVQWFMLIGLLVILCSLANYLITMTSHLRRRAWEFSLRRVLGSTRMKILYMVSFETLLTFILSTLLAVLFILLALPYFREYSNIDIPFSVILPKLSVYLALVIVGGMVISALTAWIVMRRTQHNILASRQLGHASNRLDSIGVMLQMALSMAIIFSLTVMLRQIHMLMYSDELGFEHRGLGVVFHPSEDLRQKIRQSPMIEGEPVDNVYQLFPRIFSASITLIDQTDESLPEEERTLHADFTEISDAMRDIYDLQLVEGRMVIPGSERKDVDTVDFYGYKQIIYIKDILVNETFCRENNLTPENAIGRKMKQQWYPNSFQIVGVLKDAYIAGPTQKPLATVYAHKSDYRDSSMSLGNSDNMMFRAKEGRLAELCDSIAHWIEGVDEPLISAPRYTNVEAEFEKFVASEQMLIKILLAVGGASLFVCVIGTFSLVSLALQQRRKEIAIRKVHGATMKNILSLFLRGQVISLAVAAIVAYPIAYIVMRHWLEGYAKQVGIDWWLIPTTFAAIAVVVLTTITLKIWRAAKESTVEALNS